MRRILRAALALGLIRRRWLVLPALQALQWLSVLVFARNHRHEWTGLTLVCFLVGLPVALWCVWRIAASLGGWGLGAFAGGVWVLHPFLAIPFFDPRYRHRYTQEIVPRALGLVESGEFPAMVLLLVGAVFCVRSYRRGGSVSTLLAGLAVGVAATVDAAALLFVPGALAGLLLARRPPRLLAFATGLVPGLVVVPASGTGVSIEAGNWDDLEHNFTFVREYFYSLRVLEWLPVAGVIGIARRSFPAAALIGGWLFSFLAVQGSSSDVLDGSFYRVMLPALPAYVLLASSIPLLVPAPRTFRKTVLGDACVAVLRRRGLRHRLRCRFEGSRASPATPPASCAPPSASADRHGRGRERRS